MLYSQNCLKKNYVMPQNATVQVKECAYFDFSKQSPLSKRNVVTELNMENIHLQIMILPSEMDIQ
jgi:hypothetical protein